MHKDTHKIIMCTQPKINLIIQILQSIMPNKLLLIICILISSFANAQVNVVGYIQTNGVADYPTHIDSMGKGGYIVAKDTTERNAIPCLRKKYGMACYVQSQQKLYILKDSTCSNTWVEFSGGGGSSKGGANGIDTNYLGQIVWGGTPIYTNVLIEDNSTRSHSLQYGQNTELYSILMKAGAISINPTQYPDIQPSDATYNQYKILVADTANNWNVSSINKNILTGDSYYKTTGFFIVTDSGTGQPSQEYIILENTFPNSHWGVNWNSASNTWFVYDDLSDSTSLVLNEYLNASFGVKAGEYHADAISVVMFPIDDKNLKHKYGIQVLDKNGDAIAPTNLTIDRKNKIYFEIRRYFNVPQ